MKKTSRLGMRVLPEDKARWEAASAAQEMSLSAWIETWLNMGAHISESILKVKDKKADG